MFFSTPPPSIQGAITQPGLRNVDRWRSLFACIVEMVEAKRDVLLHPPQNPTDFNACVGALSAAKALIEPSGTCGEVFGRALIEDDAAAAQAILVVSGLTVGCLPPHFLEHLTETLYKNGRVDLFRPAIFVIHNFCLELWRRDAPNHVGFAPSLQSTDITDLADLSFGENAELTSTEAHPALRGVRVWSDVGAQLPGLLRERDATMTADLGLVIPALVDALNTLPPLRPFVAPCLVALGRDLLISERPRPFSPIPWMATASNMVTVRSIFEKIRPEEAASVLFYWADQLVSSEQEGYPCPRTDQLAELLVASYPSVSMDKWVNPTTFNPIVLAIERRQGMGSMRHSLMGFTDNGLPEEHLDLIAHRKALFRRWLKLTGPSLNRLSASYDQVIRWVGPSRGNELSLETRQGLGLLASNVNSPIPSLRSALDKACLSQDDEKRASKDIAPVRSAPGPLLVRTRKL